MAEFNIHKADAKGRVSLGKSAAGILGVISVAVLWGSLAILVPGKEED